MADISKITLNGTDYNVKDANAQETLVSGTNIKTINNQSILGSGNITIQGGGGGETVIELTQAQYDALSAYAPDTTYIITDATPIDMDDYATTGTVNTLSGQVSTLSGQVSTLSGSVANKADKANVTAVSSGYHFPRYNSQGVITGDSGQAYLVNQTINGSSYSYFKGGSGTSPNIFAPTSAGTQNAVLLSNGSGAPVWASYKFQFITQTAYDALSTKDSTTIYFIVG
jgi:hypothetical protein